MKNTILILTLSTIGLNSFAQSPSNDLEINAHIDAGCLIQGNDVDILFDGSENIQTTYVVDNMLKIKTQCSKGTVFYISNSGESSANNFFYTADNIKTDLSYKFIFNSATDNLSSQTKGGNKAMYNTYNQYNGVFYTVKNGDESIITYTIEVKGNNGLKSIKQYEAGVYHSTNVLTLHY